MLFGVTSDSRLFIGIILNNVHHIYIDIDQIFALMSELKHLIIANFSTDFDKLVQVAFVRVNCHWVQIIHHY